MIIEFNNEYKEILRYGLHVDDICSTPIRLGTLNAIWAVVWNAINMAEGIGGARGSDRMTIANLMINIIHERLNDNRI